MTLARVVLCLALAITLASATALSETAGRRRVNSLLNANIRSSRKQPGKKIVVPENGIIIHKNHYSSERKSATPRGIEMNINAEMEIVDRQPADALLIYEPNKDIVPKLRFDLPFTNTTAYFYENKDWVVTTDEVMRMSDIIAKMTARYEHAICYCRAENEGEFLTCRCEHHAEEAPAPKVKHFNMSDYHHLLKPRHPKPQPAPMTEEERRRREEQALKKREEQAVKEQEKARERQELEQSKQWEDCFKRGDCEFGKAPAPKRAKKLPGGPLGPTVDFGNDTSPLVDSCDHQCSVTTLGNYTVCYAACQVRLCAAKRKAAVAREAGIMDELAQVGETLATTADATMYQARREPGEAYHNQLTAQRKALVAAQADAIKAQKDAEACHGKWTAQKTKQEVALHTEIERQRHMTMRTTFQKGDLSHLEDDALAARLRAAKRTLEKVRVEYTRMTGEAIADSKGDAAAAQCFLTKTTERKELTQKLKANGRQLTRASERLAACEVRGSTSSAVCSAENVLKLTKIKDDHKKVQETLRAKWAQVSECVTQHDCAREKLNVLKQELAETNTFEDEVAPIKTKDLLGNIPLVPKVKESLPEAVQALGGATGATGIRGFSSEEEAEFRYKSHTAKKCENRGNQVEISLIKGGQVGKTCSPEFDNCFMADDDLVVRVSCQSNDPSQTAGIYTFSDSPKNATNDMGTAIPDMIWHETAALKTAQGAALKAGAKCWMHVYGCDRKDCLGLRPHHEPEHYVGTYEIAVANGRSQVHVNQNCGFAKPAGCGWLTYSVKSKCAGLGKYLNATSLEDLKAQEEKKNPENATADGPLVGILNGDDESLLETKENPWLNARSPFIATSNSHEWKDVDAKFPKIDGGAKVTMKRAMLERDVATVEAWLNATVTRAESERGNYSAISGAEKKAKVENARAFKVVRCLNLARGTTLFSTLEKQLMKEGIIRASKGKDGLPNGFVANESPLKEACAAVESGAHFADALGMNAQFLELSSKTTMAGVAGRVQYAAHMDFVSFLQNAEARVMEKKGMAHQQLQKVHWELNQISEMLAEKGVSAVVTSDSPVASRLSPEAFAMVAARDSLAAELAHPGEFRFKQSVSVDAKAQAMVQQAAHIDSGDFAMLVNATLSCLCYDEMGSAPSEVAMESTACGPAPTPYPVTSKFHSTPAFPLSHLPPSRNELAERKRAEMRKRVAAVQKKLEEDVKSMTEESQKRAELTTRDMVKAMKELRAKRDALREETEKYKKHVANTIKGDKSKLRKERQDFNSSLTEVMKKREELLKKQEEEDHKLEEARKKHMRELEKMRQDTLKLEDDLRLRDAKTEEAWRREQDRLDELYISERSRRDKLALGYAQSSEKYKLEIMQKQRSMRGAYESELNKLERLRDEGVSGGMKDLTGDKCKNCDSKKKLRGRVPYVRHAGETASMSPEEMKSEQERETGNRRGSPVAGPNSRFPKFWKYGKSANRFAAVGAPVWIPLPCTGSVIQGSLTLETNCDLRGKVERGEAVRIGRQVFHVRRRGGEFTDKILPLNAPAGTSQVGATVMKLLAGTGSETFGTVEVGCYKETLDRSNSALVTLEGEARDALKEAKDAKDNDVRLQKALKAAEAAKTSLSDSESDKSGDAVTMRTKLKKMEEEVQGLKAAEESSNHRMTEMTEAAKNAKKAAEKAENLLAAKSGGSKTPDDLPVVLPYTAHVAQEDMTPDKCAAACYRQNVNFTYAGVKAGKYCVCGEDMPTADKAPMSSCSMPCAGDAKTACGADNYVMVFNYTVETPPPGLTPDEACAENSPCKRNMTNAKSLLDKERKAVDAQRRKWEEAVVRLARPKTCKQLQGLATGGGDGIYTIFPPEHTTFGAACADDNGNGYSDDCARMYKGTEVYCDMTTDGGGWTLLGYAQHGELSGRLLTTNGKWSPSERKGSANINSLWVVQASESMAYSWNSAYKAAENLESTGSLQSYQKVVKFGIPTPKDQSVAPELHSARNCNDRDSQDSSYFSPVDVTCLKGNCNLPRKMYTGTGTMGVCNGHAYGLVGVPPSKSKCDWSVDAQQGYTSFYVSVDHTPKCAGIVDSKRASGSSDAEIPSVVGIWVR